MTLTQLSAFVMVARLGSVKDAAKMLNVSEPAVSQALTALRQHLGDQLITRNGATMSLTTAGVKLLPVASQMVALGAEAQAAVRAGQGLPEQLRLVTTSSFAEFVAGSLTDAFSRRFAQPVEASAGVAAEDEMAVLVVNRLADMAIGPLLSEKELVSEFVPATPDKAVALSITSGAVLTAGPAAGAPVMVVELKPSAAMAAGSELVIDIPPGASSFSVIAPPLMVDGVPVPVMVSMLLSRLLTFVVAKSRYVVLAVLPAAVGGVPAEL